MREESATPCSGQGLRIALSTFTLPADTTPRMPLVSAEASRSELAVCSIRLAPPRCRTLYFGQAAPGVSWTYTQAGSLTRVLQVWQEAGKSALARLPGDRFMRLFGTAPPQAWSIYMRSCRRLLAIRKLTVSMRQGTSSARRTGMRSYGCLSGKFETPTPT